MRSWREPPTSKGRRSTESVKADAITLPPRVKREFPNHPVVGVGGVVIRRDSVLLIRRGSEPLKGRWSIPGGVLELGESLETGVRRELKEETGLAVRPVKVIAAFDRILRAEAPKNGRRGAARVRYHFVIVDYACRVVRGRLAPASDVTDARWVRRTELARYHLTPMAQSVVDAAFEFFNGQNDRRRVSRK
jgi:8-oxo-dGTP diphosphatase